VNENSIYRRIERRESHSSRSRAVVVALLVLVIAAAWAGIECVLAALGRPALLVAPSDALAWANSRQTLVLVAAVAVAIFGAVLVLLAILPSRRGRHGIPNDRMAVVVDDAVIAGALVRDARLAAGVTDERVHADVSARRARVSITPTSGIAVDATAVRAAVGGLIDTLSARPSIQASVTVSTAGRVGS
jgi:hypothetical protein